MFVAKVNMTLSVRQVGGGGGGGWFSEGRSLFEFHR